MRTSINVLFRVALALLLLIPFGCKERDNNIIRKDFEVKLSKSSEYNVVKVGQSVPLEITLIGLDPNNKHELQTIFSVKESGGRFEVSGNKVEVGSTFTYDYRSNRNSMVFNFIPTTDGEKTIEVEVRSSNIVRKASVSVNAVSPETTMTFKLPMDIIVPTVPSSITLTALTSNEDLKLTAVFVKGAGKIELDGQIISPDKGTPIASGDNRLVCTFDQVGDHTIDFTLTGRYGTPKKASLSLSVGRPNWSFSVTKQGDSEKIEINKPHSFVFRIEEPSIATNEYLCKFRFLKGDAIISIGGTEQHIGRSFPVSKMTEVALITPKTEGRLEVEFTVTDKYGTEKKDVAVFNVERPLSPINLSVSPQTQSVLSGDEATATVSVDEERYGGSFTLKFEKLISGDNYTLLSTKEVSKGNHIFRYTPTGTGIHTFKVTATDRNGQSDYEIFTIESRSQEITVTASKLEFSTAIRGRVPFEINVSEKGYNGRFYLSWEMGAEAQLYSVSGGREEEITPRNFIEVRAGKNDFVLIPKYVGNFPLKLDIKDERNQVKSYEALRFTSTAYVRVTASEGGEVEGSKVINEHNYRHTVVAKALDGYDFEAWLKDGRQVSTSPSYSFVVTDNIELQAKFRIKQYVVRVDKTGTGSGSVSINGSVVAHKNIPAHSSVNLVATPEAGSDFKGWYENSTLLSSGASYNFSLKKSRTFEARFDKQIKRLLVSTKTGGNVTYGGVTGRSHSADLAYGKEVQLEAKADERYRFTGWYEGGRLVSSSSVYSFIITEHRNLEAHFELMIYTIRPSINISEAGTVSIRPNQTRFEFGDQLTVSVVPAVEHKKGYTFEGWYQGGKLLSRDMVYTFNAKANVDAVATFKPIIFDTDTYSSASDIAISLYGTVDGSKVRYGDTVTALVQNGTDRTVYLSVINGGYSETIEVPSRQHKAHRVICRGNISASVH